MRQETDSIAAIPITPGAGSLRVLYSPRSVRELISDHGNSGDRFCRRPEAATPDCFCPSRSDDPMTIVGLVDAVSVARTEPLHYARDNKKSAGCPILCAGMKSWRKGWEFSVIPSEHADASVLSAPARLGPQKNDEKSLFV
jgi:hypothetical protein